MASGSSVNVQSFTAPRTPCGAPILATQTGAATKALRRLGGGFGLRLAFLARHGLFRIVTRLALLHAGGVEESRDAIRRLRTLGHPGFHLVQIEFQARL